MKKTILFLLLFLPFLTFAQLGLSPQQIEKNLGTNHKTEFIDGLKIFTYYYDIVYMDEKQLESYGFIFVESNGVEYCANWSVFRPIKMLNKSYKDLEPYVKVGENVWVDYVTGSRMELKINRSEGFHSIYVNYLK